MVKKIRSLLLLYAKLLLKIVKIIELFSGTESFSEVAERRGHKTFTIDFDEKYNPDLCVDILELKTDQLPFQPDVIWASPPCTEYSKAKSIGKRNIAYANKLVLKTLNIINELKPAYWLIENPQTGLLKKQEFMKNLPFIDVSYCKYGLPYRKQTRLWTNILFKGKTCNWDCDFIIKTEKSRRHVSSVGCSGKGKNHKIKYSNKTFVLRDKYKIPKQLCLDIVKGCENGF